jgi:hypothetical protein
MFKVDFIKKNDIYYIDLGRTQGQLPVQRSTRRASNSCNNNGTVRNWQPFSIANYYLFS